MSVGGERPHGSRARLPLEIRKAVSFVRLAILSCLLLPAHAAREDAGAGDQELKRMAGQMLIVGFVGANTRAPGFVSVLDNLEKGLIGGVVFQTQNIYAKADLEAMVRAVRGCACQSPPLIAIDEEGGTVDRLGWAFRLQATPSAAAIGRVSEADAHRVYAALARRLADIGFNLNFAPVVDLNRNPYNPVIGAQGRSFSADASVVARYAKIFIEEHHARGILTTLKHFPGHGSSVTDSHYALTDVRGSWSPVELVPYQQLIGEDLADSIMVGHLSNEPRWGGIATQKGATAISQMLRVELGFDGVVISDDLGMRAAAAGKTTLAQIASSAVNSGIDVLLTGQALDPSIQNLGAYLNAAIVDGVAAKDIALDRVRGSWERIMALKAKLQVLHAQSSGP